MTTTGLTTEQPPVEANDFSQHSAEVLRRLRASMAGILKDLPGRIRSTGDLQKLLGVDSKLSWQVMKVAGPGDAMQLAPFVPTPAPMRRLAKAAAGKGIPREQIDELLAAYQAFEELVATHAGDRTTFDSMASGISVADGTSDDDLQPNSLAHRKAAFKAYSHFCGMQMETSLTSAIIHPSEVPGKFDRVNIRSNLGMRRLRADADIIVDRYKLASSDDIDREKDSFPHHCFEPKAFERYGAPVMPQFSTDPLPQLNSVRDQDGTIFTSLAGEAIGQLNAVDLTFGVFDLAVPVLVRENGASAFGAVVDVSVPTVRAVVDQLVHRPSFSRLNPSFSIRWQSTPSHPSNRGHGPLLPFREHLTRLEGGVDSARILEVPNYPEILEFVCKQRGWNIEEFDVYRVRVEYPLLFTLLWLDFESMPATAVGS